MDKTICKNHSYYMSLALNEAKKAYNINEVPVGALIVKDHKIISSGFNMRETNNNSLHHAEILAINRACQKLNSWRLIDCSLYVTLEPCPMCAGAIINSRIKEIIFATYDKKSGSCGSVLNIFDFPFNHIPKVTSGILEAESSELLKSFFKNLRNKKDANKK